MRRHVTAYGFLSAALVVFAVFSYIGFQRIATAARKDIVDTLKAFHESRADAPGLQAERLRVSLKRRWPAPVFKALLDQEIRAKTVVVDGESTFRWRGRVRINNTTFASVAGDSKEEVEARITKFLDRAE